MGFNKNIFKTLTVILLLFTIGNSLRAQEQSVQSLRVAYLYYFSNLIEWPQSTEFADKQFNLCAMTSDKNDVFQLSTIEGKSIRDKKLNVYFVQKEPHSRLSQCHLLFVNSTHSSWLAKQKNLPSSLLLVTEGNIDTRSVIELFVKNKKLIFSINSNQLPSTEYKISSKLLRLSKAYSQESDSRESD